MVLVIQAGFGCAQPVEAPTSPAAQVPIRRVVLYQNGIGYFERAGTVEGNVLHLQIRPSQINDLLKSLTVIDTGSGRAVSVSLPLEENADRILNELPEQVREAGGLLEVLRVFRGANVQLEGTSGRIEGRVIGVENLQADAGAEVPADWRVSLKTASGEVVVYGVSAIRRIQLMDATLSVGLERSLDVSLGEGGWKPIGLSIRLAGKSPHRVVASYIVEMPRWKPAYRLVLDQGKDPLLQGWAVVDNVSGESWHGVQLSLVSGAPISFKYNLHAPQYAERVDLTPEGLPPAAAPPSPEEPGVDETAAAPPAEALQMKRSAAGAGGAPEMDADEEMSAADEAVQLEPPKAAPAPEPGRPMSLGALIEEQGAQAETRKVGALFRYDIQDPVTIPDRSSTLVSIVNQRISGEEVVYFRPESVDGPMPTYPYRAVKFDNKTGITLERGPITVYSSGTFVGEGFVERMASDTTSFLTFAIDGNVVLDTKGGTQDEGLRLLRIIDGTVVSEVQRIKRTTYEVENRHQRPIRAFVRSDKLPGWTLEEPPSGSVDSPEAIIVPVNVGGSSRASVEVKWVQRVTRNLVIDSKSTEDLLRLYLKGGKAPPEVAKGLEQVLAVKAEINEKRQEEARVRANHQTLSRDQDRVRANLKTLRKTPGNVQLKQDLARKLAKLEEELGQLSGRLVQLSEEIAELEARLRSLIRGITLKDTSESK